MNAQDTTQTRYLTRKEAAAYLRISTSTFDLARKTKGLAYIQFGGGQKGRRYLTEDLDDLLRRLRVVPDAHPAVPADDATQAAAARIVEGR